VSPKGKMNGSHAGGPPISAEVIHEAFAQEVQTAFVFGEGLPEGLVLEGGTGSALAVVTPPDGSVLAVVASPSGSATLIAFDGDRWAAVEEREPSLSAHLALLDGLSGQAKAKNGSPIVASALSPEGRLLTATAESVFEDGRQIAFAPMSPVLSVAAGPKGAAAIGTEQGLYVRPEDGAGFEQVYPADDSYSWALRRVRALAYDAKGRMWFGCSQGVGVWNGKAWALFTGAEGLPYHRFTCAAPGEDGVIWFGTERGAIRFDGEQWSYRASPRWLPDDYVKGIAVQPDGTAWIATPKGMARIRRLTMTFEQKADWFQEQVEARHNRDGYVTTWRLQKRGDVSSAAPAITDNDGLYTGMHGAAMVFKYAVTGDPAAKRIAKRSFEACKRLVDVVPESMKGFPARVIIPVDWPEPVNDHYGDEYNRRARERDPFWKLITPRFPLSDDGKCRWKCDTSSDELAGHYFLYAVYYDLAAETEEEKAPVREVVRNITDHLIRHGFNLVDHDGEPTRWGRFGPDYVDTVYGWSNRGLNSMMLLSFLAVAEHVTGDAKYAEVARMLRAEHRYHINAMIARPTFPPEDVVPWDNNLALLCLYPLVHCEQDPELLLMYRRSLQDAWLFCSKQKNPLWNFIYGAGAQHFARLGADEYFDNAFPEAGPYTKRAVTAFSTYDHELQDSIDTLQGMPLDLVGWRIENSHRLDVELDNTPGQDAAYGWSRVNGKALPIEERCHVRQDRDAFALDATEGDGWSVHEGTFYLLPYWMGRYHGFLK